MKNSEKTELKRDIRDLAQKGYSQKEAVKILKEYGYCESTARSYWKVFSPKFSPPEEKDSWYCEQCSKEMDSNEEPSCYQNVAYCSQKCINNRRAEE